MLRAHIIGAMAVSRDFATAEKVGRRDYGEVDEGFARLTEMPGFDGAEAVASAAAPAIDPRHQSTRRQPHAALQLQDH